jgi:hypothetical protein
MAAPAQYALAHTRLGQDRRALISVSAKAGLVEFGRFWPVAVWDPVDRRIGTEGMRPGSR